MAKLYAPKQAIDGSWHAVFTGDDGTLVSVDQFACQNDCRAFCKAANIEAIQPDTTTGWRAIDRIMATSYTALLPDTRQAA